jgi:hypothetical protein
VDTAQQELARPEDLEFLNEHLLRIDFEVGPVTSGLVEGHDVLAAGFAPGCPNQSEKSPTRIESRDHRSDLIGVRKRGNSRGLEERRLLPIRADTEDIAGYLRVPRVTRVRIRHD